jgi:hypothetical protein
MSPEERQKTNDQVSPMTLCLWTKSLRAKCLSDQRLPVEPRLTCSTSVTLDLVGWPVNNAYGPIPGGQEVPGSNPGSPTQKCTSEKVWNFRAVGPTSHPREIHARHPS